MYSSRVHVNNSLNLLSELEASGRIPSKNCFRSMPCQTFIACGNCPYNDRCVFLHDGRIKHTKGDAIAARAIPQTAAAGAVKDTFYWPDMTLLQVLERRDARSLPSNDQEYVFPLISTMARSKQTPHSSTKANMHDLAVYSIWMHFVESLRDDPPLNETVNAHTGKSRLKVFVKLASTPSTLKDSRLASTAVKSGYFLDYQRNDKFAADENYNSMNFRDTELFDHHTVPKPLRMRDATLRYYCGEDKPLSLRMSQPPHYLSQDPAEEYDAGDSDYTIII